MMLALDLAERVAAIRRRINIPLVVGFGDFHSQQVHQVARVADGVVVGSAFGKLHSSKFG